MAENNFIFTIFKLTLIKAFQPVIMLFTIISKIYKTAVFLMVIFFIFAVLAKYGIANIGKAFAEDGLATKLLGTCREYADLLLQFKKK